MDLAMPTRHVPYTFAEVAVREINMETAKLTVRLPKADLDFAKRYARAHRMTLTELIDRHLRRLRSREESEIHPEIEKISGLLPTDVDAKAEFHQHLLDKH